MPYYDTSFSDCKQIANIDFPCRNSLVTAFKDANWMGVASIPYNLRAWLSRRNSIVILLQSQTTKPNCSSYCIPNTKYNAVSHKE